MRLIGVSGFGTNSMCLSIDSFVGWLCGEGSKSRLTLLSWALPVMIFSLFATLSLNLLIIYILIANIADNVAYSLRLNPEHIEDCNSKLEQITGRFRRRVIQSELLRRAYLLGADKQSGLGQMSQKTRSCDQELEV